LRDDEERFAELGDVALVGQGRPEWAEGFCRTRRVRFPCLVSPDNEAHRAYGLERGSLRQVAGPKQVARGALSALSRGAETMQGPTRGDSLQLGGAFVVDTEGIVRYAHRARGSSDNPSNAELLEALRAVVEGG
jgi:peroxiredoxin